MKKKIISDNNISLAETGAAQFLCSDPLKTLHRQLVGHARKSYACLRAAHAPQHQIDAARAGLDRALQSFAQAKDRLWTTAVDLYRRVKQGAPWFTAQFPSGLVVTVRDLDFSAIRMLAENSFCRVLTGTADTCGTYIPVTEDKLHAEVRLKPSHYGLLWPDPHTYHSPVLAKRGALDEEQAEMLLFLHRHPDIKGGLLQVDLENEDDFLNFLFIEGVPMSRVKSLMLQHPDMTGSDLQVVLQLLSLQSGGARVIESGTRLVGAAGRLADTVTCEFQHKFMGGDRELSSHPCYRSDIRDKYSDALSRQADLELRHMGVIRTRPESYLLQLVHMLGHDCAHNRLADTFNHMFADQTEKVVQATVSGDTMRLDIFTSNPDWRQQVLDLVNRSWEVGQAVEIVDLDSLPAEMAEARRRETQEKNESLFTSVWGDYLYFHEKGTDGFIWVGYDRSIHPYGELLTDEHIHLVESFAASQNYLQDGMCVLRPCGPERRFIDLLDYSLVRVFEESVMGQRIFINMISCEMQDLSGDRFVDVTGRVSYAAIDDQNGVLRVCCLVDGQYQLSRPLDRYMTWLVNRKLVTPDLLAYNLFSHLLVQA